MVLINELLMGRKVVFVLFYFLHCKTLFIIDFTERRKEELFAKVSSC